MGEPSVRNMTTRGRPRRNIIFGGPRVSHTAGVSDTKENNRFVTTKPNFHKARNSVELGAAWMLVANILSKSQDKIYTVPQCKEKVKNKTSQCDIRLTVTVCVLYYIKWLRRKWSTYRAERSETGNLPRAQDPPCLDLMMEHWGPHEGVQNTTLCDAETTHSDEDEGGRVGEELTASTPPSKRKKTTGESIESGLKVLAEGVKSVGDAMKSKAKDSQSSASEDILTALGRQEAALNKQTEAIKELVRVLDGRN
ncbi:unnamed protein product [Phytophthora fragariaefolia]|uniref:Unnamed protein product n=1 Tax=Phytophthora fragariaefolia TaxID=1490495 RepID=A0A9W7D728_9STRA|nr:unnamed protein product [Phytophthora fragariaefolia]